MKVKGLYPILGLIIVILLVITCRKDMHQVEQNSNPFKVDTLHSKIFRTV